MAYDELLGRLRAAIVEGDELQAASAVQEGLDQGIAPLALIQDGVTPALEEIGRAFGRGDAFLPQLILAGDAALAAVKLVLPRIAAADQDKVIKGKVVIGTIFGDAHDIGKNIVIGMLSAHGLEVVDLGVNVSVREYVEAAIKEKADIIAISSLLTTSLPYQRELVTVLRDRGLRERFFVVVGGGPVTPQWTHDIGADGYGRDAADAASLCQRLLDLRRDGVKAPLPEPIAIGALQHS